MFVSHFSRILKKKKLSKENKELFALIQKGHPEQGTIKKKKKKKILKLM